MVVHPVINEAMLIYNYFLSGFIEEKKGVWLLHTDMSGDAKQSGLCMAICSKGEHRSHVCKYSPSIISTNMTTHFVGHYSCQN